MTDCAGWFGDGVWPVDRRDLAASFVFKVPLYREFLLFLDREANVRFHVVMSKCDLLPRVDLAKRCAAIPAPRLQPCTLHPAPCTLHPGTPCSRAS